MKNCRKCLTDLPKCNFYSSKKNIDGLQSYCKKCSCSTRVNYYKDNRDSERVTRNKYRNNHRELFLEYKKTQKCSKCEENRWYVLDFHHLNNKKDNVSNLIQGRSSWETILNEIKKCIVLCANCHREEHYFKKNYNKIQ